MPGDIVAENHAAVLVGPLDVKGRADFVKDRGQRSAQTGPDGKRPGTRGAGNGCAIGIGPGLHLGPVRPQFYTVLNLGDIGQSCGDVGQPQRIARDQDDRGCRFGAGRQAVRRFQIDNLGRDKIRAGGLRTAGAHGGPGIEIVVQLRRARLGRSDGVLRPLQRAVTANQGESQQEGCCGTQKSIRKANHLVSTKVVWT